MCPFIPILRDSPGKNTAVVLFFIFLKVCPNDGYLWPPKQVLDFNLEKNIFKY